MDKKAKKILIKTYWSFYGWKDFFVTSIEDYEYAKSKGLMFDPLTISKDELLLRLDKVVNEIAVEKISDAFILSLNNKRLDWRSGIASYINAKRLLSSKDIPEYFYGHGCYLDLNIMNFERIKWGGIRHNLGVYNLIDLELLNKEEIGKPSKKDIFALKKILEYISSVDQDLTPKELKNKIYKVFKASTKEREILIDILAYADILKSTKNDRFESNWNFDMNWTGKDGYNSEVVNVFFGRYGVN